MTTAAIVPSAIPLNVADPAVNVKSAIATISPTPAVNWLTGRLKSTLLSTQIFTPITPISPYSAVVMPPSTPAGIALTSAPTFGERPSRIAVHPATQ